MEQQRVAQGSQDQEEAGHNKAHTHMKPREAGHTGEDHSQEQVGHTATGQTHEAGQGREHDQGGQNHAEARQHRQANIGGDSHAQVGKNRKTNGTGWDIIMVNQATILKIKKSTRNILKKKTQTDRKGAEIEDRHK